jgi:uncharacterized protein with HEPN domain
VDGRNRSDLESDEMLLFALVRAIEIVSEAASKISDEARAELRELPWASIVGMRHRLVHAYFEINRDILWTTVTEAVPRGRLHYELHQIADATLEQFTRLGPASALEREAAE